VCNGQVKQDTILGLFFCGGVLVFAKAHFEHPSSQRGKSLTGLIKICDVLIRAAPLNKTLEGFLFSGLKWVDAHVGIPCIFSTHKDASRKHPLLSLSETNNLHVA